MVRKFFCLRLETAAMLTGWIGTVGSMISIVFFGLCLGYVDTINKKLLELRPSEQPADAEDSRTMLVIVFMSYLVLNAINLAASFALLIGTLKEKHLLFVPWLTNSALGLAIHFMSYLVLVAQSMQISSTSGYVSLVFGGIGLALYTYIWLAVYSHYKNIQGNRDEQQSLLRPRTRPLYVKT